MYFILSVPRRGDLSRSGAENPFARWPYVQTLHFGNDPRWWPRRRVGRSHPLPAQIRCSLRRFCQGDRLPPLQPPPLRHRTHRHPQPVPLLLPDQSHRHRRRLGHDRPQSRHLHPAAVQGLRKPALVPGLGRRRLSEPRLHPLLRPLGDPHPLRRPHLSDGLSQDDPLPHRAGRRRHRRLHRSPQAVRLPLRRGGDRRGQRGGRPHALLRGEAGRAEEQLGLAHRALLPAERAFRRAQEEPGERLLRIRPGHHPDADARAVQGPRLQVPRLLGLHPHHRRILADLHGPARREADDRPRGLGHPHQPGPPGHQRPPAGQTRATGLAGKFHGLQRLHHRRHGAQLDSLSRGTRDGRGRGQRLHPLFRHHRP